MEIAVIVNIVTGIPLEICKLISQKCDYNKLDYKKEKLICMSEYCKCPYNFKCSACELYFCFIHSAHIPDVSFTLCSDCVA